MARTVVVVGSSVGGVRAALALRAAHFDGRIVLVGEEPTLPYDKPPLSKQYLAGAWDRARITLLDETSARRDRIELALGVRAVRLDVAGRVVVLADGTRLAYDQLVIATGASARPAPWPTESGVHVVRTLADSEALRRDLAEPGPVVVVGGGFIGAEVAASARALGHEVTVVDPLSAPMGRVVGTEIGQHLSELHHRHGVVTRFGVGVEGLSGRRGDLDVELTDGSHLSAAVAVVGIGAVPNDGWLAGSGIPVDGGVLCDQCGRAVDVPDVFAVGDVARWLHPERGDHQRVEHWTNAVEQAVCVAHNIVHPEDRRAYRPVEYVWSDQYDWKIQLAGRPTAGVRHQVVGSFAGADTRVAVLYGDPSGRLCGAVTVNWPRALAQSRRLLSSGTDLEAALAEVSRPPEPAAPVKP